MSFIMARPAGLEPATPGLEGRCSIRLSYGRNGHLPSHYNIALLSSSLQPHFFIRTTAHPKHDRRTINERLRTRSNYSQNWSGQRDSNSRPSAPKADALPGCAMPRHHPYRTKPIPSPVRRGVMIRGVGLEVNLPISKEHSRALGFCSVGSSGMLARWQYGQSTAL